jgi:hypothetical protein
MRRKKVLVILVVSTASLVLSGLLGLYSHRPAATFSMPAGPLPGSLLPIAWVGEGTQGGGEFAYAVATAGDIDGDGYDDVVVGAPRNTDAVYREGVALVYRGSPGGLSSLPAWQVGSGQSGSRFANAVATAGDVNGDGYDDLIVGAYEYNNGTTKAGAAFVYLGSSAGLVLPPVWQVISPQGGAGLGYAVASAGDVNGDGFDDIIVGARWQTVNLVNEGAAYVYYGSPAGPATDPDWQAVGGQTNAAYGSAVASAGDVNNDGYDDVIVGAPYYDDDQPDSGAVYLYLGSAGGLATTPSWTATGHQANARFGTAVGQAHRANADPYSDIVVGAPGFSGQFDLEGAAFLFPGGPAGPAAGPTWTVTGGQANCALGISAGSAGDVNGDGFDDLLVGAHLYTGDQSSEGAAFLFLGGPAGPGVFPVWHGEGNKAETGYGFTSGTAGDINGDGYADLLVGAPQYRQSTIIVGRAFAYHGAEMAAYWVYIPAVFDPDP